MTFLPDVRPLDGCDDPASVLGYARDRKRAAADAEREVAKASAKWLSMHATGSLVGPVDAWHERTLPLGGEGCPEVAEFAVTEYAAALGLSPESGRTRLALYAEGFYRLTRCWDRLERGDLEAWRLRMIAERTLCLSPAAAAFVDQHVASVAHKIGPAQLLRLVEEAKARFDPDQAEAERLAAAEARHVDIDLAAVGVAGTAHVDADLDLADALDLEAAVADVAHQLLLAGCTESLDIRRSMALGLLARGQLTLPSNDEPEGGAAPQVPPTREVVLHAHVSATAVTGAAAGRVHQGWMQVPSRWWVCSRSRPEAS